MAISGSNERLVLDGTPFHVLADANFTETGSRYEKENVPTSGDNITRRTIRSEDVEGVVVKADGQEMQRLTELDERVDDFGISYTTADGTVRRCRGTIAFESRETEELRATLNLLPRRKWRVFNP